MTGMFTTKVLQIISKYKLILSCCHQPLLKFYHYTFTRKLIECRLVIKIISRYEPEMLLCVTFYVRLSLPTLE